MKTQSVHQKIEELVQNYLNIPSLHKDRRYDRHDVSVQQVEKALRAAFLMGEKLGYSHGFNDASEACDCSLEDHVHETKILQMHVDREKQFV